MSQNSESLPDKTDKTDKPRKPKARFTEENFHSVYSELIEENPLAVRAVLKILKVEFTNRVPTLAVTLEERPRLLVNLEFITEHCRRGRRIDEKFVKAVICHEFLHVLLRHTEKFNVLSPERHIALDAVINAIIHRDLGSGYSDFMRRYYREAEGILRLLRPPKRKELPDTATWHWRRKRDWPFKSAWKSLYEGRLMADDIEEIARDLAENEPQPDGPGSSIPGATPPPFLLGGHDPEIPGEGDGEGEGAGAGAGEGEDEGEGEGVGEGETQNQGEAKGEATWAAGALGSGPLPEVLSEALDHTLKTMNGSGIWRSPHGRGVGAQAYSGEIVGVCKGLDRWKRETRQLLRRYLQPDRLGPREELEVADYTLPVLSTSDRRAALRAGWSPFLPNALWSTEIKVRSGTAQVYLDVSGSMNAEMPLIVGLLHGLRRYIRRPFWAFSDVVAVAEIVDGQLRSSTTGGTSMACVLRHVIETRPLSAVVVTDGYIERLDPDLVRSACAKTRLHALVTRDGNGRALQLAGIDFTQLGKVPQ
jgi:hypothetical protein